MSVAAVKEYIGVPRDVVGNYHGNLLVYVTWDQHLLFAAPVIFPLAPDMKFGEVPKILAGIYAPHPDAAQIDWNRVEWFKSQQPWHPDYDKTVAENGIGHKEFIRLRTPGLTGIRGLGL